MFVLPNIDDSMVFAIVAGCLCGVAAAVFLHLGRQHSAEKTPPNTGSATQETCSFLFNGDQLIDYSASGHTIFKSFPHATENWQGLASIMQPRFPTSPDSHSTLPQGQTTLSPADTNDRGEITFSRSGASIRVVLGIAPQASQQGREAATVLHMMLAYRNDLRAIKAAFEGTPHPIWMEDKTHSIIWANSAFRDLERTMGLGGSNGAPTRLFAPLASTPGSHAWRRDSLTLPTGQQSWFDLCAVDAESRTMMYALNVDTVVNAEIAQRNFVQILTKTFAHLSIGLAIFNRDRQLALFNPALIDLTDLPAEFLTGRPTIMCFFDRLRDNHTMPEPKNYANWRARVGTVVAAASDGSFRETWALPDGRTFRVTGRPHPDGAVAFMFEDISHEISLTRSFRSELALGASVLNALDQSIAVFGPDGRLEFCNAQFQAACKLPSTISETDHKLAHAQDHWKRQFAPSPALAQFLAELAEPDGAFQGVLTGKDHTKTDMRLHPLAGGMRMVAFQPAMDACFATPA